MRRENQSFPPRVRREYVCYGDDYSLAAGQERSMKPSHSLGICGQSHGMQPIGLNGVQTVGRVSRTPKGLGHGATRMKNNDVN